jgi:lysophospholipase L1-like esterase
MTLSQHVKTIPALLAAVLFAFLAGCSSSPAGAVAASVGSKAAEASSQTVSSSEAPASSGTSSLEVSPAAVPKSTEADPSFLNDAVFVGDSVTLKLKNYATLRRKTNASFLGKAKFLAAGSMGSGNALNPLSEDSIHPLFNGEKALLEDSAAKMGAKKIYIMLGVNDLALYGVEGAAQNLQTLGLRFLKRQPDAVLYIESATPMLKNKQMKTLNNANLEKYNQKLVEICGKQGWYYLDVASVLRDSDGSLKKEYCSDPDVLGLHFTDEACDAWIHYILTHTGI